MEVLWAPWRKNYVTSTIIKDHSNCIFCKATQDIHSNNYVIYKSKFTIAILNKYPYNNAHTMVAPIRHIPSPELLNDEELLDLIKTINVVISAIKLCYNPDGINIGANIGRAAGAGVEGHLHIHIVPRWIGDTNFMAIIARTKVIPESLEETCSRLTMCINKVLNLKS
ncbi:MAG: HIT domain-containing protein [Ignisphaera sp.]